MEKNIKGKVDYLRELENKPIGIFGARASGKTIFFSVMYGINGFNNEGGNFSTVCTDDESRKYLKKNFKYLLDGKLPPRTEVNDLTRINMSYHYNNNSYNLKSFDFAGELIKDISDQDIELDESFMELQTKIYEFFSNCSGLLIFIEPNEDKQKNFERQTEIDKLLSFMKNYKERWDFNIPMGVVITKWDKLSEGVSEKSGMDIKGYNVLVEEKEAEDYVKRHAIFNNIYSLISGVSKQVKIFPVSAFGESRDGDLPPFELRPFNLFAPLVWVSEKRDVEWKEKINEILSKDISSKKAKQIVESFRTNVVNKKLLSDMEKYYTKFKTKKRKKRILITSLISIAIIAGAAYYGYNRFNREKDYSRLLRHKASLEKIELIKNYKRKYGVRDKNYKDATKEMEISYYFMLEAEENYDEKLKLINNFLESFKNEKDKLTEIRELREYVILQKEVEGEEDFFKKYDLINNYTKNYPKFKEIKKLKLEELKYLKLSERKKYEEIKFSLKKDDVSRAEIFEKITNYIAIESFEEYRKEIIEIKENLKDEDLYQKLLESIEKYNTSFSKQLAQDVSINCESYLSNSTVGRYQVKVKDIINKLEELQDKSKVQEAMEIEFFVKRDNFKLRNKRFQLKINIDSNSYVLRKNNDKSDEVYLGSLMEKITISSEFFLYLTINGQPSLKFRSKKLSVSDIGEYIILKDSGKNKIRVRVKIDKNKFRLGD